LITWIEENSLPLLGTIGPENYQKYLLRGLPLLWLFVDFEKNQTVLDTAREVAKDFREVSFVQLDGIRWADHSKSFGLSGATPGIVIEDRDNHHNYVFPQDKPITAEDLRKYVRDFVNGTLEPTIRSQPIPEDNSAPLKVLVGKNFEQIVMDPTKDVLVEFYAPWCGHCKSLVPKYEKLATMFASESSIVIAKIDATENDTPVEIQGFPTIILFTAADKENPITYDGDRTADGMAEFIRENASTLQKEEKDEKDEKDGDAEEKDSKEKDEL